MPVALKDQTTEDIFDGTNSKEARKVYAQTGWSIAARKLDPLDSVQALEELKVPSGLDVFQGKSRSQEPHQDHRFLNIAAANEHEQASAAADAVAEMKHHPVVRAQ